MLIALLAVTAQAQHSRVGYISLWEPVSADWVDTARITNCYDAQPRLHSVRGERWVDEAWQRVDSVVLHYDALLDSIWAYEWSVVDEAWLNKWLTTYAYASNDSIEESITYTWNNSAWSDPIRKQTLYDVNGFRVQQLQQALNGGDWEDIQRTLYVNDIDGRPEVITKDSLVNLDWATYEIDSLTLDIDGREVERTTWVLIGANLTATSMETREYDDDGHLETITHYLIIPIFEDPIPMTRTLVDPPDSDALTNRIVQFNAVLPNPAPEWVNDVQNAWEPDPYPTCDIAMHVPGHHAAARLTLAPNPSPGFVMVQLSAQAAVEHLLVRDAIGRVVHVEALERNLGQVPVDLSGLENGIYIVEAHFADGTLATERVMKE